MDTGFASYRYQTWNRWPLIGPTQLWDSLADYDNYRRALLATKVPLGAGMFYFDARLCGHQSTVEVRVADVCLQAEHAAVIATLIRALVDTAARSWQAGAPPPAISESLLRAWSWQASFQGVSEALISPATGTPTAARTVVTDLVEHLRPVLLEYGEMAAVEETLAGLLAGASGAQRQREGYATSGDLREVASFARETTHSQGHTGHR